MKRARVAAVGVPVLVVALGTVSTILESRHAEWYAGAVFTTLLALTSALGALLVVRRGDNPVAWLLLVAPLPAAIGGLASAVAVAGDASSTLVRTAANLSLWIAQPSIAAVGSLLFRFPTGAHKSARWRRFESVCYLALALGIIGLVFRPGGVYLALDVDNPLGIAGAKPFLAVFEGLGGMGQAGLVLGGALSVILRWRHAPDAVRHQIKWVAFALATFPGFIVLGEVAGELDQSPEDYASFAFNILGILLVPASIAVAVLKYRLYDIDVVINRTLVYGTLTAVLVGSYTLAVLVFRTLLDPVTGDNDIAVAASTLAVAALFGPARRKIQAFIDRRFYRSRYDAQQTLEAFAARLRDEVDLDAVSNEMLAVVSHSVHPRHASVWLVQEPAR